MENLKAAIKFGGFSDLRKELLSTTIPNFVQMIENLKDNFDSNSVMVKIFCLKNLHSSSTEEINQVNEIDQIIILVATLCFERCGSYRILR